MAIRAEKAVVAAMATAARFSQPLFLLTADPLVSLFPLPRLACIKLVTSTAPPPCVVGSLWDGKLETRLRLPGGGSATGMQGTRQ